jgi:hypothetical protein
MLLFFNIGEILPDGLCHPQRLNRQTFRTQNLAIFLRFHQEATAKQE